jgi:hypothetical protein
MIVTEEINHPHLPNHRIQFGISTWTEKELPQHQTESVRRSVYNGNGIFSPHGSSEVPIEDMLLLLRECIKRKKISRWDTFKAVVSTIFKR